jgi:hypothetical protein
MTPVQTLREPAACQRCYTAQSRDMAGGADIKKHYPKHLKAICWAYTCDACAEIVIEAILMPRK